MRRRLIDSARLAVCLLAAITPVQAQRPVAFADVVETHGPAAHAAACVTVHDVWRPHVEVVRRTEAGTAARASALEQQVRLPYADFWDDYVGGADVFARWVGERVRLEGKAQRALAHNIDVAALVEETTRSMADFTGRVGCGEWYVVFGPGRTDMGSLGDGRMVIDFTGIPADAAVDDIRFTLAHEVNHLIFTQRRAQDADAGTVLYRMIDEGLAAFVAQQYDGASSPARALSWTEAELAWARAHEKQLFAMLRRYLTSRHDDVFDLFFLYDQRVRPEAPGKIGYYLGYRVVQEYVRRHGPAAWKDLYEMDVAEILQASRIY